MNKLKLEAAVFEKIDGQLKSLHEEIGILSKKSPDGKINAFKIQYINAIITKANDLLQTDYLPLPGFTQFDSDLLPSNSDIVFVLSQYINCMEQLRTENITTKNGGRWYWKIGNQGSDIPTAPPKKLHG